MSSIASFHGSLAHSQRNWSSMGQQISSSEVRRALDFLVADGRISVREGEAAAQLLNHRRLTGEAQKVIKDFVSYAQHAQKDSESVATSSEGAFRGVIAAAHREFSSMGPSVSSTEMERALGHLSRDGKITSSEVDTLRKTLETAKLTGNARKAAESFLREYNADAFIPATRSAPVDLSGQKHVPLTARSGLFM
jgi:hypothetical protein